jgi:hypothetical protein
MNKKQQKNIFKAGLKTVKKGFAIMNLNTKGIQNEFYNTFCILYIDKSRKHFV